MKHDSDDLLIRQAFSELPEAPDGQRFRSRVLAVAAVTPQDGREELGTVSTGLLFLLRSGGALFGFGVGVGVFLLTLSLSEPAEQENQGVSVAVAMATASMSPYETMAAQFASNGAVRQ